MLSWKLGTVGGIELRVHATMALLLLWIGASGYGAEHSLTSAASAVAFTAAIFAIVVLHELGHAFAARSFGIGTRDITLYPMGGVARLERLPATPWQELIVAVAGPMVNVGLAGACAAALLGLGVSLGVSGLDVGAGPILARLLWANVVLAVFNLLPAFPMDGGRVLRAFLAFFVDYVRATRIALSVGRVLAVVFAVAGLLWNPILVLIAFFIWTSGGAELSAIEARRRSGEVAPVRVTVLAPPPGRDAGA